MRKSLRRCGRDLALLPRLHQLSGSSNLPATIPGTVMSSSSDSHLRAYPLTSIPTSRRSSSEAVARRRDRSAGKAMQRPSCSSRWIILPSPQTRIAADSATGDVSARMAFIVSVGQLLAMFENKTLDFAKIVSFDSSIARKEEISEITGRCDIFSPVADSAMMIIRHPRGCLS